MPSEKMRLDTLLTERGLVESRAKAQALIMDGKVRVKGEVITKPGTAFASDVADVAVEAGLPYVSRGGFKLEKALDAFQIDPAGAICLDIGAATGGFTDCLLQRGATKVYAVDVGTGQLDWKLRTDDRVVVLEKTNIRHLSREEMPEAPTLAVCDASFISLKKTLPPAAALMAPIAQVVALLKPQFEYKDYVSDKGFKGVVTGEAHHRQIIAGVLTDLQALLPDWQLAGVDYSPITGPKGNIEYLLWLRRDPALDLSKTLLPEGFEAKVVAKSYEALRHAPLSEPGH